MTKTLSIALIALFFCTNAFANSFILEAKDIDPSLIESSENQPFQQTKVKAIFPSLGLYEVSAPDSIKLENVQSSFRTAESVKTFTDHTMTLRGVEDPSDKDFSKQWGMSNDPEEFGIRAADAWQITTGGENALGKEIVIAVVDGSFDVNQEDLIDNLWVNTNEIPDNGIDDDKNGYVDDIYGWDVPSDSGDIGSGGSHGTHVAGIMGASGDNEIMVTGVNWNVKIMLVSAGRELGKTSSVLKAYNYILEQKALWMKTKGKRGANVVAINSSFGIDFGDCTSSSYSLWNDVYNELGKVGILSAAATANRGIDVDAQGDVPTSCSSPYIISVTNSTQTGSRNNSAAYGTESIDLAAPGTGIYSTIPGNRISKKTGTSMSTPHVTGAIGLLHSAASEAFAKLAEENPAKAALVLKEIMLSTVTEIADFKDEMTSGGILNVGHAADVISEFESSDIEVPETGDDSDTPVEEEDDSETTEDEDSDDADFTVFKAKKSMTIPDSLFGDTAAYSKITSVPAVKNTSNIKVKVHLSHAKVSDLKIVLIAPNGRRLTLQDRESHDSSIFNMTFGEDKSPDDSFEDLGRQPKGKWTLMVLDKSFFDEGTLISWELSIPKE